MRIEAIAKIAHQSNKAFCESIGDYSQKDWADAAQWQRESMIAGVKFRIEHMGEPAVAQHGAWCAKKLEDGWTHGPVKDENLKTHPCLVPFNQLPPLQQAKDFLSTAIIEALVRNVGITSD